MAEKVVKSDELIEDDIFKPTRESAEKMLPVLKELEETFKRLFAATKESVKANPISSVGDINNLTSSWNGMTSAIVQAEKIHKQIAITEAITTSKLEAQSDELVKRKIILQDLNREDKLHIQAQIAEAGSITQLTAKLSTLNKAYKDMSEARRNSAEGTSLLAKIQTETAAVSKLEQSMGIFNRNVGNYKSGYDGLAQSINQLTRELPNAAQGAQLFFLAISNNIPMFTDQIKKLKDANIELEASGKPTVNVLGAIGKAFFSWQSLISVGVTLLTVYGAKMVEWITNTEKATTAQKELEQAFKDSSKELETWTDKAEESTLRLRVAMGQITKEKADEIRMQKGLNRELLQEFIRFENEKILILKNYREAEPNATGKILNEDEVKFLVAQGALNLKEYNKYLNAINDETKKHNQIAYQIRKSFEDSEAANKLEGAKKEKVKIEHKAKQEEETLEQYYNRLLEDTKIFYEREQLANDAAYMNNEIGTQEHNDRKEDLTIESLKVMIGYAEKYGFDTLEFEKRLNDLQLAQYEKYLKERKGLAEKEGNDTLNGSKSGKLQAGMAGGIKTEAQLDAEIKARIKKEQDLYSSLAKISDEYYSQEERKVNRDIANAQRRQDQLALLAQNGVENAADSIALEQKKEAEAEARRAELLREKQRREFALTVLKMETANLEANPDNPGKATADTAVQVAALVSLINGLPSFFVGTEDTGAGGGLDGKGGFLAVNHPHERIIPAHENKLFGGVPNTEAAKVMSMYNSGLLVPYQNPFVLQTNTAELGNKLDNVVKAIENIEIPLQSWDYNAKEKAIIERWETKNKVVTTHIKQPGGIW